MRHSQYDGRASAWLTSERELAAENGGQSAGIGQAEASAPAADAGYLFAKYGLSTQAIVETIWSALGKPGRAPTAPVAVGNATSGGGRYSPVLPLPVLNKSLGAS